MKKLLVMVTIGLAAVCGFGSACTPDEVVSQDYTRVYQVKMTLVTTEGTPKTTSYTTGGSVCAPGETVTESNIIREKSKITIQGWIYDCVASCNTVETGSIVLWDAKRKVQITDPEITTAFLNVIGKKQTTAEWRWTLTGTAAYADGVEQTLALEGAGLGSFTSKKGGYYTSFSGNVAGTMGPSYDLKHATCEPSQVWKCDDLTTMTDSDTVAYGSWTIKYNATASKKYAKNGYLAVPSYVEVQ